VRLGFVLAALLCFAGAARAQGKHLRLDAGDKGPIHVYQPPEYDADHAAVVIYVHGFYTNADEAWSKHKLARQFRASRRNALFVVPEAPVRPEDEVTWPRLGELLRTVEKEVELPRGPVVAVGHSAAYRTMAGWLDYGPLDVVILVDALYGSEEEYHRWLTELPGHASHRLLVVASDTQRFSDPLMERLDETRRIERLPSRWERLPAAVKMARVVYVRTRIGHMELVTKGTVLPVVLGFGVPKLGRR
jgi:hypothetical protein